MVELYAGVDSSQRGRLLASEETSHRIKDKLNYASLYAASKTLNNESLLYFYWLLHA